MRGLNLESFDALPEPEKPKPAEDAGFAAGYEAGHTAAIEAAETRHFLAVESAAQRLADLEFTFAEVSQDMLQTLSPLFRAIIESLVPTVAKMSLAGQIDEQLSQIAAEEMSQLRLHVAREDFENLSPVLSERYNGIVLEPSDTLTKGQARLAAGDEPRLLDLGRAEQTVTDALNALIHETERMKANG